MDASEAKRLRELELENGKFKRLLAEAHLDTHALKILRPKYPGINHKRVCRIYTAEGLSIRKRKKTKRDWRTRAAGGGHGSQPDLEHGFCERRDSQAVRGVTAHQMPHSG